MSVQAGVWRIEEASGRNGGVMLQVWRAGEMVAECGTLHELAAILEHLPGAPALSDWTAAPP